jgi:hypothetical protein
MNGGITLRESKMRKPAAIAAALALAFAVSACGTDDPDTTDPADTGSTTSLVDEVTTTAGDIATTTTAAG